MGLPLGDTILTITKYWITVAGAILMADAIGISPIKFDGMDKVRKVIIGAPLFSSGIVMIALSRK